MKQLIIAFILLFSVLPALGQELRLFTPIKSKQAIVRKLAPGAHMVEPPQPLPAGTINHFAETVANTWNTADFQKLVSESFYNKSRLDDAMGAQTAKDAQLKILGKHNASILSQIITPDQNGGRLRVSVISVVLDSRAEFTDARNGFVSVPGTNEMIMEVVEKIE